MIMSLVEALTAPLRAAALGLTTAGMAAWAICSETSKAAFRALEGNNLQRWSDPRLLRLAVAPVSCAVILSGVAVHRELPGTR